MNDLLCRVGLSIMLTTTCALAEPPALPPMPAVPDGAPSAEEYVKGALEALRDVKAVAYSGTYARWKNGEPAITAEGDVYVERADERGLYTERCRVIGTYTEWPDGEPTAFELWSDGSMITYIDHRARTVHRIPTLHGGIQFKSWNPGTGLVMTQYRAEDPMMLVGFYEPFDLGADAAGGRRVIMRWRGRLSDATRVLEFDARDLPVRMAYRRTSGEGDISEFVQEAKNLTSSPLVDRGLTPTIPPTYQRLGYEWPPFDPEINNAIWPDRLAPAFTVRNQDGVELRSEDMRGRVIFASSGFPWSKLTEFKEKYGDRIVVAHMKSDVCPPRNAEEVYRQEPRSFDLWEKIPVFEKALGEAGCPTWLLIGAHGEMIAFQNQHPWHFRKLGLERFLEEYMAQLNVR